MSFFYFIEKVFSWNEIIIPMLSMSFESSLIWYSERGQTSIFITHSKCHFHAAILLPHTFLSCMLKKPQKTQAHERMLLEFLRLCMILSRIIVKSVWSVRRVGVSLGTQEPCPPSSCDHKGDSVPEGSHRTISPFPYTHSQGCEGVFSSAQAEGAAWPQSRESNGLISSLHAVPQDCCQ